MKKIKILLMFIALLAGYFISRPYVHITADGEGTYLFYRDSVHELYQGVVLWWR